MEYFIDKFDNNPGVSDLVNAQPIHLTVTLGEWRALKGHMLWSASTISTLKKKKII